MLKLVKCEFWKLKRKKFIPLVILSAFLFPVPLTYLMTTPSMMERYTDKADAFDGLFNMVLGYGIQFLLPCIIGIIAAMLFFMERDNDTFKNLRTIPVTSTQMVLAKVLVLFLFGVIFCVASTIATILCGFGTLPIHLKLTLTIKEAAEYSNIGINKIDTLLKQPNCPFVLFVGTRKLVKRREFEEYIRRELII